jgi:transcriptional regulator with XRE-family HTH domain
MSNRRRSAPPVKPREGYGENPERILGMRLRRLREEAGMTQAHLAERMTCQGFSMHQTTIAKIEANQRPVTVNEAVTLATVLNIPMPWLLTDPELDEETSALWGELRKVAADRLAAEREHAELQAARADVTARLSQVAERRRALDQREGELQGLWRTAQQQAMGQAAKHPIEHVEGSWSE